MELPVEAEYLPAVQAVHDVCPELELALPAAHAVQMELAKVFAYRP